MTTLTDVFPKQMPYADGHLLVPEGPGLGIELNEDALADVAPPEPSTGSGFRREDGSYTNW
jgi:L-alanine-DL-glutamate epimerase-like enolase superfamily enzyme